MLRYYIRSREVSRGRAYGALRDALDHDALTETLFQGLHTGDDYAIEVALDLASLEVADDGQE